MTHGCSHGPPEGLRATSTSAHRPDGRVGVSIEWGNCAPTNGEERVPFVRMSGELDMFSATEIEADLLDFVGRARTVVIDLSELTFVDNAGWRLLERLRARGDLPRRVRLHAPSRAVRRMRELLGPVGFDVCGLDQTRPVTRRSPSRRCSTFQRARASRVFQLSGEPHDPQSPRLTIDATVVSSPPSGETGTTTRQVVYTVRGELDVTALAPMTGRHAEGFSSCDAVTVDLSAVSLIDNAGVRFLENLATDVLAAGGCFAVRDPSTIVQHVVDALGVQFDGLDEHASG